MSRCQDGRDAGFESFGALPFDAEIEYIGPDEFDGECAAPDEMHGPYEFRHVSVGGTLTLATRFNGRRHFAPDHPANDPEHWRRT